MVYRLNKSEKERLQRKFSSILLADNEPGKEDKVVRWVRWFLRFLGVHIHTDKMKNTFFKVSGEGNPLLLAAHLDSVAPAIRKRPKFEKGVFRTNGKTVLGADDLAGVMSILFAIWYLKKNKISHRPLEVLFTAQEEVGGRGVRNFDLEKIKAKEGILPDLAQNVGTVVYRTPTKYTLHFHVKGRSAHIREIEKGLSAIQIMSELVCSIPLGKVDKDTTVNIGSFIGGRAGNVVPEESFLEVQMESFAKGEIRSTDHGSYAKVLENIERSINKMKEKYPKAEINFDYEMDRPGFELSRHSDFFKSIKETMDDIGKDMKAITSHGLSDANNLNAAGIKAILIGTGAKNTHTTNETIELSELINLTEFLINHTAKTESD